MNSNLNKMILEKTANYMQLRNRPTYVPLKELSVSGLRRKLKELSLEIGIYNQKLEKINLPSFINRNRKSKDIKAQKEKIEMVFTELNKEILGINISEMLVQSVVQEYFLGLLKRNKILFKSYEQKEFFLLESKHQETNEETLENVEEFLVQDNFNKSSQIKFSLLNLTNTIMQLKILLKSQLSLIDTIDLYFDKSNVYLEEANLQIEKIPKKYTKFKDAIIYTLLYLISVLLIIILIKVYHAKHIK